MEAVQKGLSAEKNEDYEQAYQCFSEAAQAGNPVAAYFIGNLYYYGRYGTHEVLKVDKPIMPWDSWTQPVPDYKQAFAWFMKAAEGGYADGMNNVGVLYHFGQGVEADDERSKQWLQEAAAGGVAQAKAALKDFFGIELD